MREDFRLEGAFVFVDVPFCVGFERFEYLLFFFRHPISFLKDILQGFGFESVDPGARVTVVFEGFRQLLEGFLEVENVLRFLWLDVE